MDTDTAGKLVYGRFQLHGENGFTHQVCRTSPYYVYAEDLSMAGIRNDLHGAFHLAPCHSQPIDGIWEASHVDLQPLLFCFLFGNTNRAHFRKSPQGARDKMERIYAGLPHAIFRSRDRHGRCSMTEHPPARCVPDGVNPLHGSLQPVVHPDAAVFVQLNSYLLDPHIGQGRFSRSDQYVLDFNGSLLSSGEYTGPAGP